MYYTYILFSEKLNRFYIGQTNDLESRLNQHNSGKGIFTGKTQDWIVVFSQQFNARADAMKFETKIKNRGAKRFLNDLQG